MNPELLLAHFNLISDAPDAVPRLRRFILDLAVRGKLVGQDPSDEPATELLTRIQVEKARLLREGKTRSPRAADAIDDEPKLYTLPNSWIWCRLSEVGAIVGGGTPPSGDANNFAVGGAGIAWLTPADLGKHFELYISHGARDLTAQGLHSSSATVMPKGSVLFTSRAPIGYTAIAANDVSTNQGLKSVAPYILECNLYIAIYFRAFGKWIDDKASGTTFREVSGKIVASLPFPLPPLAEQYRIAAKVDELMLMCDRLEAAREERGSQRELLVKASLRHLNNGSNPEAFREHARFYLRHLPQLTISPAQIPALRQTILNLAAGGQLVPQHPDDEPATELLKRIQTEIAQSVGAGDTKERKKLQLSATKDPPFDIPRTWAWVALDQIVFGFRYGTSVKCSYERAGEPVLRIPNIVNGGIRVEDLKFGLLAKREADELRLRLGDILMVRSNGSLDLVGRPALVDANAVGYCYAGYLIRVRISPTRLDARYVLLALNSSHVRDQIEIPIRTTVGLKNVNTTELGSLVIPLPPLAEQSRVVAKVDDLMALCDRLERQLIEADAKSSGLLEAVLHHALTDTIESTSPKRPNPALLTGDHIRGTTQSCRGGQKSDFGILSDAIRTALE
jgi:type I restriction enzyme, S subunit